MGWVYLFFVHKWRVLGSTSVLLSRPKTKHKDTGRRWKEHRSTPFQKSLKSSAIWKWTVPNMETQAIPRPFRWAATDRICMDLAPDLRWRFCRASRSSTTSWSSAIQQFYSRLTSWNVHQRQCLHTSGLLIKTFQVLYVCMYIYNKPFINWMWIIQLKNNTNIPITYASKKCFYRWMCMHSWRHVLFGKPNPAQQQPLNQYQSFIQWSCDPPRNWSSLQETHPNQNQKQSHETYQIYPNLTSEE